MCHSLWGVLYVSISLILFHSSYSPRFHLSQLLTEFQFGKNMFVCARVCVFVFSQAALEGPVLSPWVHRTHCLWLQLLQRLWALTSKELIPTSTPYQIKTEIKIFSINFFKCKQWRGLFFVLMTIWRPYIFTYRLISLRCPKLKARPRWEKTRRTNRLQWVGFPSGDVHKQIMRIKSTLK